MVAQKTPQVRTWPTTQITLLHRLADQHDKASWDCFVQTYGSLIHTYCLRRGLQESDAYDVVQEVLLQVSKGIGRFRYDSDRGQFRNWLGTVTHRAMLKYRAKAQRTGIGVGDCGGAEWSSTPERHAPLDETWVESFNAHVFRAAVKRVRLHFRDDTWKAFEATFIDGRRPGDVAEEQGRSIGWVYQAKSQVVRQLTAEILYLAEDSVLLNSHSAG